MEKLYDKMHENRTPHFKNMVKKIILVGGGLFFGLGVMTIGIAFISQVKNMVWILFGGWIITQAYAFMRIWDSKNKVSELLDRVEALQERYDELVQKTLNLKLQQPMAMEQPNRRSITPLDQNFEISVGDDQAAQQAIWESIQKDLPMMNYYEIEREKNIYKEVGVVRGNLLNRLRKWNDNPGLDKNKPLGQIEREIKAASAAKRARKRAAKQTPAELN